MSERAAAKRAEVSLLRTKADELRLVARGAEAAAQIVRAVVLTEVVSCLDAARKLAAEGQPIDLHEILRGLGSRVQEAVAALPAGLQEQAAAADARADAFEEFARELDAESEPPRGRAVVGEA